MAHAHRSSSSDDHAAANAGAFQTPGKQTLTQALPVQAWAASERPAPEASGPSRDPAGVEPAQAASMKSLFGRPPQDAPAEPKAGSTGLPEAVQHKMEQAFGTSFAGVTVHASSGKPGGVGAKAIAQGNEIHFAPGAYQPETPEGQEMIGHELAHVVQQRAGRVQARTSEDGAATLHVDKGLEREADDAGKRAARGESVAMATSGGGGATSNVAQPMLGFEIEMLVLVDSNGRPIPEKTQLGTCGPHLTLDVDHGPAVAAPTPTRAAAANYDVGLYHPVGTDTEIRAFGGGVDPRPGKQQLDAATWAGATAAPVFTRPASPIHPHVNNAALALIDPQITAYQAHYRNWERTDAVNTLTHIITHCDTWLATNTNKPNKVFHPHRRARWRQVRNAVRDLRQRAVAHRNFWIGTTPQPPAHLRREVQPPLGAWAPYQPDDGMGTDQYASILEIVTNAYEPETPAGRANIVQAMTDAVTLANNINGAMGAGRNRVQLNTLPNIAGVGANVHVGNPAQLAQTTDGSIQATGAIDLAQFPSYVQSVTGTGGPGIGANAETNTEFRLKHHDDFQQDEGRHVLTELPLAVANATTIINHIKGMNGGGGPDLQNLRGLVTLICQYLRMGKLFFNGVGQPLDKNIVPMLSRTNLSQIYDRLVPAAEKNWLAQNGNAALTYLLGNLPAAAGRNPASDVYNDALETHNGDLSCAAFVSNVFTQPDDGLTDVLAANGTFRTMDTEDVDPLNARGGDTRSPANHPGTGAPAPHREGFVFEMRNMVKRDVHTMGRFPTNRWLKLAEQQAAIFASLNARTEASAVADQRTRYSGDRGGGGARRFNVATQNDANW